MIKDIIKYTVWVIFVLTVIAFWVTFFPPSARLSEAAKLVEPQPRIGNDNGSSDYSQSNREW
jgi:hypothetical protein